MLVGGACSVGRRRLRVPAVVGTALVGSACSGLRKLPFSEVPSRSMALSCALLFGRSVEVTLNFDGGDVHEIPLSSGRRRWAQHFRDDAQQRGGAATAHVYGDCALLFDALLKLL